MNQITERQKVFVQILWACDTTGQVDAFIQNLPTEEMRHDARVAREMIVATVIDEDTQNDEEFSQVAEYLSRF